MGGCGLFRIKRGPHGLTIINSCKLPQLNIDARVFPVLLRRPDGAGDPRTDPFYELGSFGLTDCHRHNLLHPTRSRLRDGDRLAFVQGGPSGSRLLLLTPAVRCIDYRSGDAIVAKEIRWNRRALPLRYGEAAPLLGGRAELPPSDLPVLRHFLAGVRRSSAAAKLASCFRARCAPLDDDLAAELIARFERAVTTARPHDFIENYTDAVPGIDPRFANVDRTRAYRLHVNERLDLGLRPRRRCGGCRPRIELRPD